MLFIATDIDGLYTANPRIDADAQARSKTWRADAATFFAMAGGAGSGVGTGGMRTKLEAAAKAAAAGIATLLFNGTRAEVRARAGAGPLHGTRFRRSQNRVAARKYWLRNVPLRSRAACIVDAGAARAMIEKGASLLPGGVIAAEGDFRRGDMVEVRLRDEHGDRSIARGVSQYSAVDIRRIARRHSRDIEAMLGYNYGENVIHRDDLVFFCSTRQ